MSTETNTAPEVKPAIPPTVDHSALLAAPLGTHVYDNLGVVQSSEDARYSYSHQCFNFGLDGMLIGDIRGDSRGRTSPGYPSPTIPEAEAIRAEIIRRWNCHAELVAGLQWCIRQMQGELGAGENYWEQFPEYVAACAAIESATAKETAAHV